VGNGIYKFSSVQAVTQITSQLILDWNFCRILVYAKGAKESYGKHPTLFKPLEGTDYQRIHCR